MLFQQPLTRAHSVTVRAPGKVNLQLSIGPLRDDGYHHLATVFQAVSLFDDLTVTRSDRLRVRTSGENAAEVPDGQDNLAGRAAALLAARIGVEPLVDISIRKRIPVGGGMAGGSADAAGALVACAALWQADLGDAELLALAARLGSDVSFSLLGGMAIGERRGEALTPLPVRSTQHWVFALADTLLSTPRVFAELDRMRDDTVPEPVRSEALLRALDGGDPVAIGRALTNEAQPAALALAPGMGATLAAGQTAGALGSIVSGTGATCAFLARDEAHARQLAAALEASGTCRAARHAYGPVPGPAVIAVE
ncbi:4-diphosphocytidyl-2-C-methyl-D-erythritol kinase [Amycolatopsis xylanica]|uniref:4-diphosphocytidyl-2-C-methyl-D-erythritol kinase n=1 Tax=Amycolatopsis xylanica TaxID=589385 RepID=A0A1H2RVQ2_9PSEU|nr:4-(cytidine 5'-diphospho)-2-C-methyl-D-erythritol kinase [Amycolatopsis xylanica]SDW23541.1 4-diphosphocytidyl-2-C-methyl-D-erythritol kinase [Amycolatopsis xylanica]